MAWNEVGNNGSGGGKGEVKYAKFQVGVTQLRVLDEEPTSRWTHWIPQANGGKGMSVNCIGKGCPLCAAITEDKKNKVKSKYSSSKSHALNALVRSFKPSASAQATAINEVQVLDKGNKIFGGMVAIMEQMGDLRNYDITVTRTGEELGNINYTVLPVFSANQPLSEAEKAMEKYDMKVIAKDFTKEQIIKLMNGATLESLNEEAAAQASVQTEIPNGIPSHAPMGVDFTRPV